MDYTKKENRIQAVRNLQDAFIERIHDQFPNQFADELGVRLLNWRIEIGVRDTEESRDGAYTPILFGSKIDVYANRKTSEGALFDREANINHSVTGSFTPFEENAYYRTIHAAAILTQWDKFIPIVDEFCRKYRELMKEFEKPQNKVQ